MNHPRGPWAPWVCQALRDRFIRGFFTPGDPRGKKYNEKIVKTIMKTSKKNWVPGVPRDEIRRFREKKMFLMNIFLFFLHKSFLSLIIDGFELIKTWGIDRRDRVVQLWCRMD